MGKQGQKKLKARKQRRRKTIVYHYYCRRCGKKFVRRPIYCPKCKSIIVGEL